VVKASLKPVNFKKNKNYPFIQALALYLLRDLCWHSLIFFAVTVLGYFAAAGSLYWLLYLRRSSPFALAFIASADAASRPLISNIASIWASIRSDVTLSVLSSGIFALCAAIMTMAYRLGSTRLYLQPEQYGLGYLGFSLVLVLVLQDAYFYFTHRLSHHPKCYKWLHQGHHHSKNPTPWTAFAFDPAEAMIQSIYLMGVTLLIPMHLSVLVAVVMVMTMGALIHHFGVRLFPDSALGKWLGSWMIGCTHHWLHHRKYTVHYSLYFTFWDRLLGTQYEGYENVLSPSRELTKANTLVAKETVLTSSSTGSL
jgi:Delta7-sterol 5-desaturase